MLFKLSINLDNGAFAEVDGEGVAASSLAIHPIRLAQALENLYLLEPCAGKIRDINGNTVGSWKIEKA